ncbi:YrhC family protein [Fredinandcohnia sp. 179-A 10B2 NHS]|uniref:YrhC family protein n=1 Tax=Fredinandcohnia sp. 179-A 10B2 NHS TaxID=3235176 RepID=UPI0039A0E887
MNHDKDVKTLRSKIADYTNFAYILLAISTFLYIGVIIPEERAPFQIYALMGFTLVLLSVAFVFFKAALKYKKQMNEIDEQ